MTIIFIENLQGSGKAIKIVEDFGDYAVHRDLAPGESACIGVAKVKALLIEEIPLSERPIRAKPALVATPPASEAQLELRYA